MSWTHIAWKELGDTHRNRQLYGNVVALVIIYGLVSFLMDGVSEGDIVTALAMTSSIVVPVAALLVTHEVIVRRRENGQLTLLLGLAHDRREVVLGAYVGRFVVLTIAVMAGLGTAITIATVGESALAPHRVVGLIGFTLGFGLSYVAIGISISTLARSTSWSAICAFVLFVLLAMAWYFVPGLARELLELAGISYGRRPWWEPYLAGISPNVAYMTLVDAFVALDSGDSSPPVGYAVGVLAAWTLVPALAFYHFDASDL